MKKIRFIITAEYGLHARPATKLVTQAMSFDSNIYLTAFGRQVNLKSIMGVMSLGIYNGEIVEITADGGDEEKAVSSLSDFIVAEGLGRVEYE